MLQARSIFTTGITTPRPGVRIFSESESNPKTKDYKAIEAVILYKAIRNRSLQELEQLCEKQGERSSIEDEIILFMKNLRTQKHILLFLPYELGFDSTAQVSTFEEGIKQIEAIISEEFAGAMQYRRNVSDYDTYMTFLFEDAWLIDKIH